MKKIVLLCVKNYDAFACSVAEEMQRLPTDVDLILFAPPRYRFLVDFICTAALQVFGALEKYSPAR